MFDNLSQSLEKAWDVVRKDGKLTPENVKGPMREIRRSLLEADVCPLTCMHHGDRLYNSIHRIAAACLLTSVHDHVMLC